MGRGLQHKREIVIDLSERFSAAQSVVIVDFSGISAKQVTQLRNEARAQKIDYLVAKNNLIKRAVAGTPLGCLGQNLVGPTAVGIGYGDSLSVVKLLSEWAKNLEGFKIKGGFLDGAYATEQEIREISRLPSRQELLGKLLGVMRAPTARLVSSLHGTIAALIRTLDAIREKKGNEQPASQ